MKKYRFIFWINIAILLTLTAIRPAGAELTPMDDNCLADVCGTSGISIAIKNVQIFHHIDTIKYCATDNGSVEFQNFSMYGNGDVAMFNYDFGTVTDSGILHLDVFTPQVAPVNDWAGFGFGTADLGLRGMTSTVVPKWDQKLGYAIESLVLHDPTSPDGFTDPIDLGAMAIGLIDLPRYAYYTSPRIDGIGFDFQLNFQMTIDKIGYAYNDYCDAIEFCPIYIGEDFTDLGGDDPRYPTSWKPNQTNPLNQDFGDFQIGDLFGDISDSDSANWEYSNPAMIDVARGCELYGDGDLYGFLNLGLPMSGSIRFESVAWHIDNASTPDVVDFGPGAIDGIQVHRLNLQLIP